MRRGTRWQRVWSITTAVPNDTFVGIAGNPHGERGIQSLCINKLDVEYLCHVHHCFFSEASKASSAFATLPSGLAGSAQTRPAMLNVSRHMPRLARPTRLTISHACSHVSTWVPQHRFSYAKRIGRDLCAPRSATCTMSATMASVAPVICDNGRRSD